MYEIKYRDSSSMKSCGIEGYSYVPKEWIIGGLTKYLEPIIDYRGKTPEKVDEGTFLVTARNIKNGKIDYSASTEYVKTENYKKIMSRGLPKTGDVLFTTEAPLGEVANVDVEDIALAQRIVKFDGVKKYLDNYYLKYTILSFEFQQRLKTFATGSTALGIKASKFPQLKIYLPRLNEQQKIANFLEIKTFQFDSIISEKVQLKEKLELAKKSLIFEVVTGKVEVVDGLLVERDAYEMKDSGIEWLGEIPKTWNLVPMKRVFRIKKIPIYRDDNVVLSLTQKGLKIKNLDSNKGQHASSYSGYQQVLRNDFVMNHMDLLTGYVDCSTFIGVTSPDYRVFKFAEKNRKAHQYYLKYFQMGYTNRIFYSYGQGVSYYGRWRLQTESFKYYPILDFAEDEQISISNYLESRISLLDATNAKIASQIEFFKQAKLSMITEAVTGKIDLRDWGIIEEGEI